MPSNCISTLEQFLCFKQTFWFLVNKPCVLSDCYTASRYCWETPALGRALDALLKCIPYIYSHQKVEEFKGSLPTVPTNLKLTTTAHCYLPSQEEEEATGRFTLSLEAVRRSKHSGCIITLENCLCFTQVLHFLTRNMREGRYLLKFQICSSSCKTNSWGKMRSCWYVHPIPCLKY